MTPCHCRRTPVDPVICATLQALIAGDYCLPIAVIPIYGYLTVPNADYSYPIWRWCVQGDLDPVAIWTTCCQLPPDSYRAWLTPFDPLVVPRPPFIPELVGLYCCPPSVWLPTVDPDGPVGLPQFWRYYWRWGSGDVTSCLDLTIFPGPSRPDDQLIRYRTDGRRGSDYEHYYVWTPVDLTRFPACCGLFLPILLGPYLTRTVIPHRSYPTPVTLPPLVGLPGVVDPVGDVVTLVVVWTCSACPV